MHRICPHCWHSLDAALRANPALELCPDCGGDIVGNAPVQTDAQAEVTAAHAESEETAAANASPDETDIAANEAALAAIDQESAAEVEHDTSEPLPELEAKAGEGVAEAIASSIAAAPAIVDESTPSFTRNHAARPQPRNSQWQWGVLIALGLLLGLQILLADRERLAADPDWRPVVGAACGVVGCKLPPWREPQAFAMLSRDVRPQQDAPGTLLVQATFRNDARWAQPWPALQLTLSDADGRVVGARVFTAKEYLDKSVAQAELSPGQSAQVSLRLREPQTPAVAFTFDFR